MEKLKLAFVLPIYAGGGAERVTDTIAAALEATDQCSVSILVWHTDDRYIEAANAKGLDLIQLPDADGEFDMGQYRSRKITEQVGRIVRREHFDVLIMSMVALADIGILRRMAPRCRLLFHLHGEPMYEVRDRLYANTVEASRPVAMWRKLREGVMHKYRRQYLAYYAEVYNSVDGFIVLCDSYRQQLIDILSLDADKNHVEAIYNPLASMFAQGTGKYTKTRTVLYVGRLDHRQKRIDRLLHTWAKVAPYYPDWTLKIVGDGPDRERLEDIAVGLDIAPYVEFCGYTPDPWPYYAEARILALTSAYEGWPCTILEGMAAGVVPIAMDCCKGVHEMLDDNRGVLTPTGDISAMADALSALIADGDSRAFIRRSLPEFVARFSAQAVAMRWLDYLKAVVQQ
jgi:glycosyltransferase involved in cell wall biosynthesis